MSLALPAHFAGTRCSYREKIHDAYIHDGCGVGRSSYALVSGFRTAALPVRHGRPSQGYMLVKAVAAVKADKTKALDMFNKGEGGFLDRDLYVFCFDNSDGKNVAMGNPNAKQLLGTDARTLKDPTGKAYGLELYA